MKKRNYQAIIEEASDAAALAPKGYAEITYRAVLDQLLRDEQTSPTASKLPTENSGQVREGTAPTSGNVIPRLSVSADEWEQVFDEDKDGVHLTVNKVPGRSVKDKQVNLALLLALKLWKEKGEVVALDTKTLTQWCHDHGCYDGHITGNLKNSGFFRKQGRDYKLIKQGELAAAELVKQVAGTNV